MKTLTRNFLNSKIQPLCENVLSNLSFWLWQLPLPGASFIRLKTLSIQALLVLVYRDLVAGLHALINASTVNNKIYVGLILMLVVAPLSYCTYELFDRSYHVPGWYHLNFFHLFFLIRFQIAFSVFFIGLYYYLPSEPRVKILSIPLGFLFMSIAINVMADSNDDIWRIANASLWAAGICLSLVIFYGLDYFSWRKFHRADAYEKRLDGIAQVADELPPEKVASMFVTTWRERREFKSKG